MFGLFNRVPECSCGRSMTVGTDGLENYWHCYPCRLETTKRNKKTRKLEARIAKLEKEAYRKQ